jgi:hypothetical protein
MPPVGFEFTIPASGRPQTNALDRAATGIGLCDYTGNNCGHWNSRKSLKKNLETILGKHVIVSLQNAWNITRNAESIAV